MMPGRKIRFNGDSIFFELDELIADQELSGAIAACVEAQKRASMKTVQSAYQTSPDAKRAVSEDALNELLRVGEDVNGIRSDRSISNVIVFNDAAYADAVMNEDVGKRRRAVDLLIYSRMQRLFEAKGEVAVLSSGFFLYPPGGYMSWHTNSQTPGWRLYVNYVEEPGQSFFRYRDPRTQRVITSVDKRLNFRLFRVSAEEPLWHTIYSDTNRYSLGYKVVERPATSFTNRVMKRLGRMFSA